MPGQIPVGEIHHLRLTVTDVQRSREFYTGLLGFQVAMESPPPDDPAAAETFSVLFGGCVMIRGNLIMGLRPMAPSTDRFDPKRHAANGLGCLHSAESRHQRQTRVPAILSLQGKGLCGRRAVLHPSPPTGLGAVPTNGAAGRVMACQRPAQARRRLARSRSNGLADAGWNGLSGLSAPSRAMSLLKTGLSRARGRSWRWRMRSTR